MIKDSAMLSENDFTWLKGQDEEIPSNSTTHLSTSESTLEELLMAERIILDCLNILDAPRRESHCYPGEIIPLTESTLLLSCASAITSLE
jgi:hypothetical protein